MSNNYPSKELEQFVDDIFKDKDAKVQQQAEEILRWKQTCNGFDLQNKQQAEQIREWKKDWEIAEAKSLDLRIENQRLNTELETKDLALEHSQERVLDQVEIVDRLKSDLSDCQVILDGSNKESQRLKEALEKIYNEPLGLVDDKVIAREALKEAAPAAER